MDVSRYVQKQPSGIYRYYRRVPTEVATADKRTFVKVSLKTRDHREALERAAAVNHSTERLWRALAAGQGEQEWEQHAAAIRLAQSLGFTYHSNADLAHAPMPVMGSRLRLANDAVSAGRDDIAHAAMGAAPKPNPRISNIWSIYEHHGRAQLLGMSPRQLSKHKVSRLRAITYLQDLVGDLPLAEVDRAVVLRFRDWWVEKVTDESLRAYSANRSITDIAGMLTVIDGALQTTFHQPWEKARVKETNKTKLRKRAAFSVEWVQTKLLAPGALDGLNLDARLIIFTMMETGMRLSEVCNLRSIDVHLEGEVPHVEVAERDDRRQKTDYSIRRIPLVGVALWAMRQAPGGFARYADKGDSASAAINKFLWDNKLRPTKLHTVYSLRHTFQDRILRAGALDRMQADLMGHEFGRPTYGDGADMKQRQDLLEGIKFDWQMTSSAIGDPPLST